jgi:DNA mismatch repair protein MutL
MPQTDAPLSQSKKNPVQLLPSLVAERIAAGEVIERPASVVKELVENSIDAGSTQIEVQLVAGGRDLISVTDNGSGMSVEDLELSVCRHATSKIRTVDDLMGLTSLGFRGEALPSIGSVASLTMTSRATHDTYQIHIEQTAPKRAQAVRVANQNFLGGSTGTVVEVKSLFSQIPARLKFLKSPGAEASAVREILERLALSHPQIRFKLNSDDRTQLDLPLEPIGKRIARILGDNNPFEIIHAHLTGGWEIELYWLKGLSQSNTRSLIQVVNGRAIRDRILQQALLLPLKQSLLPGQFPALVAYLNIPPDELDVNVHPNKTEVRFLDSKKIFALCQAGVHRLLDLARPQIQTDLKWQSLATPLQAPLQNTGHSPFQTFEAFSEAPAFSASPSFEIQPSPLGQFRGILFSTYFVFEKDHELIWIDQHAAHERIRYEKLKRAILNQEQIQEQALLVPEVIQVRPESLLTLKSKIGALAQIGFEAEVFGEQSIVFRTLPAAWGTHQLPTRLYNLLERLESAEFASQVSENLIWDETLFEKVAMEACRSSYKAGDYLDATHAEHMARELLNCEHFGNCPHGRPTLIRIPKSKVEEWFQRKI